MAWTLTLISNASARVLLVPWEYNGAHTDTIVAWVVGAPSNLPACRDRTTACYVDEEDNLDPVWDPAWLPQGAILNRFPTRSFRAGRGKWDMLQAAALRALHHQA